MGLELKVGERYFREDGDLTDPLEESSGERYPFIDPKYRITYQKDGKQYKGSVSSADLVRQLKVTPDAPVVTIAKEAKVHSPAENIIWS